MPPKSLLRARSVAIESIRRVLSRKTPKLRWWLSRKTRILHWELNHHSGGSTWGTNSESSPHEEPSGPLGFRCGRRVYVCIKAAQWLSSHASTGSSRIVARAGEEAAPLVQGLG